MSWIGFGGPLIQYNWCTYKKEIWTHIHRGRMPHEGVGKGQGDAAEAKECEILPANQQQPGERHGTDLPQGP